MRDFIVLGIILGAAPFAFFYPYFGILMWNWIAYFNPHRFTWGAAYDFPVAMTIAIPTLVGSIFTRERNHRVFVRETVLLLLLWTWFGISLLHAMDTPLLQDHIAAGQEQWQNVTKIMLMTFLSIFLVTSEKRLKGFFLVTGMSFGALALKGALFGLRTSGVSRVWGPPDSFIADNNDLALAMNMILPTLFFLGRSEPRRWLRLILWISFFAAAMSVILSYSRGGLLGLLVCLGLIAIKARKKALAGVLLGAGVLTLFTLAPPAWMGRMENFFHGNLDESAQLRLNAWSFAITLAQQYPLTGGGFQTFTIRMYSYLRPDLRFAGPHSIYFGMLGEQGFVGLLMFLFLLACTWHSARRIRRQLFYVPSARWMEPYTHAIETGLLAYMVSGAFLPRAYFDLFYQFVAAVIILKILYLRELAALPKNKGEISEPSAIEEPALT